MEPIVSERNGKYKVICQDLNVYEVTGNRVTFPGFEEYSFFIYLHQEYREYKVSELTTGRAICQGKTKELTVKKANDILQKLGIKKFIEAIIKVEKL